MVRDTRYDAAMRRHAIKGPSREEGNNEDRGGFHETHFRGGQIPRNYARASRRHTDDLRGICRFVNKACQYLGI